MKRIVFAVIEGWGIEMAMECKKGARNHAAAFVAAAVFAALVLVGAAAPQAAYAADDVQGGVDCALTTQATGLASAKASTINSTVKKNAAAIVKAAKATSGTSKAKLKKIFAYVAQPKEFKGAFTSASYLSDFYFKAKDTANAEFYPAMQPDNMKTFYKKYAIDAYKTKKAVCYHYASLFAVAAKKALGSKATVKIAVGGTNINGSWNPHHSWVEVTLSGTTYVYDPMNGMIWARDKAQAKGEFGVFCGTKKSASKVKKYYKSYKGAVYCTVKL